MKENLYQKEPEKNMLNFLHIKQKKYWIYRFNYQKYPFYYMIHVEVEVFL